MESSGLDRRISSLVSSFGLATAHISCELFLYIFLRRYICFNKEDDDSATLFSWYCQFTKQGPLWMEEGSITLFYNHDTPVTLRPDQFELPVLDLPQSILIILDEIKEIQATRHKARRAYFDTLFVAIMLR